MGRPEEADRHDHSEGVDRSDAYPFTTRGEEDCGQHPETGCTYARGDADCGIRNRHALASTISCTNNVVGSLRVDRVIPLAVGLEIRTNDQCVGMIKKFSYRFWLYT